MKFNISIKSLLYSSAIIYSLNAISNVVRLVFGINEVVQYVLLISVICDLIFIIIFINYIKYSRTEYLLFIFIFISAIIGMIEYPFSRRHITDFLMPVLFISKVAVVRGLPMQTSSYMIGYSYFFDFISKITIYMTIVSIVIYFVSINYLGMTSYSGNSPLIYFFFVNNLIDSKYILTFFAFLISIYSGNRASVLVCFILTLIIVLKSNKLNFKTIGKGVIVVAMVFILINIIDRFEINAFQKYALTIDSIMNFQNDEDIDIDVTAAGRFDEIISSTANMDYIDYVFGRGIGFTYEVGHRSVDETTKNVSNVHFTPIGIITKYGSLFYLLFMIYYINGMVFLTNSKMSTKNTYILIAILFDSFFAYTLIINTLIPICLGYNLNLKKNGKILN